MERRCEDRKIGRSEDRKIGKEEERKVKRKAKRGRGFQSERKKERDGRDMNLFIDFLFVLFCVVK